MTVRRPAMNETISAERLYVPAPLSPPCFVAPDAVLSHAMRFCRSNGCVRCDKTLRQSETGRRGYRKRGFLLGEPHRLVIIAYARTALVTASERRGGPRS